MVRQSLADLLTQHVTAELESIDRMYLNGYIPMLQTGAGFAYFVKEQFSAPVASTALIAPMSRQFVMAIERFAKIEGVDLYTFSKGERKDDVAQTYLRQFPAQEGVLFVGKAQEKATVFRTEKRRDPTGRPYPWIIRSTAFVNHYYFYLLDRDFGPLFIKFCSYFPYAVKVCLNGHEWLKCQLAQRGIPFTPLDNGLLHCADWPRAQRIAGSLDARKIDAVFRKWLRRLPHPFKPKHRQAGYRYQLSILQAEFALTQILDRPLTGRAFFEEVIRENLDLGRPDQVQLIFNRRINRRTPGPFRTRVLTDGVVPSLHVDYKSSRIKQYHKEGRGLRTETTINNTYDFAIGRGLSNLSALRKIGFDANRRLLCAQQLSHDCLIGEARFRSVAEPQRIDEQRVSGLPFGTPPVQALTQALCLFSLPPEGLRHRDLRRHMVDLWGVAAQQYGASQMTYDLRRLRLHGLIERIPSTHRYRLTDLGAATAQFYTRLYGRALRPVLSLPPRADPNNRSRDPLTQLHRAIDRYLEETRLAA